MHRSFKLSSFVLLLALIIIPQNLFAQLTGIKTIPGNYATIAAAIADLNTQGVGGGGVTFNVTANHTESTTDSLVITATGTSGNPIAFQKSGVGSNPRITRTDAGSKATSVSGGQGDAVITLQGSDYITFDAIDAAAEQSGIEYGYYLRKMSGTDGCKNVTIKNSTIDLTKGTNRFVYGIYSSNNDASTLVSSFAGITVTSTGGRNENITIIGNTIQDVHWGIFVNGFDHTAPPYDFLDQNLIVGQNGSGNTIRNFGGGNATSSYGVYVQYSTNPTISYNTIDNVAGGGVNATSQLYGIYMGSSSSAGNFTSNYNTIILGQGSVFEAASIYISPACISATVNNNTFGFGTFASAAPNGSYFIKCSNATTDLTINNNQNTPINKSGAGSLIGFYNYGGPAGGTALVQNNNFSNITLTGASGFYGIYYASSIYQTKIINGNTISNITGGTSAIYGIYTNYDALNSSVYLNTVANMTAAAGVYGYSIGGSFSSGAFNFYRNDAYNLTATGTSAIYGVYHAGTTGSVLNSYRNNIYNITGTNASALVYGMYISAGTTIYAYNNFISEIKAPAASGNIAAVGIYVAGGSTVGLYYNTVYLDASSSSTTFGSAGIYASTTPTLDMRDNIVVNVSVPGNGAYGAKTVAYRRSTSTLTTYATLSNNNCFYAGTPDSARVIYFDGGTNPGIQTMAAYKTLVSPRDVVSFTENPAFANVSSSPYDLHLNIATPTQCESGGIPISSPVAIIDDFDGNTRSASFPDVGADEFSSILLDSSALAGNYTVGTTLFNLITGRNITFEKSVKKVMTNVWVENPKVNSKQGNDGSYQMREVEEITWIPMENGMQYLGNLYVKRNEDPQYSYPEGVNGIYATITAAVADLNVRGVSAAVNFLLTDAAYSSETLPITIDITNSALPTAVNTVTIKPNTGVTATVSGSSISSVFKLNGADYIIIDGSNSDGTTRNLTIANTAASGTTYVVQIASKGTGAGATFNTIRNCIIKNGFVGSGSYGIYASGDDNDNLTIQNNSVSKAYVGIYIYGNITGVDDNLLVSNNLVGSNTEADYIGHDGIMLSQCTGASITGNKVFNIIGTPAIPVGITLQTGFVNSTVSKNDISNIINTGFWGWGGRGLYVNTGSASSNLSINNNFIYAIGGIGYVSFNDSPVGMYFDGITGSLNIYFNSVYMSGALTHFSSTRTAGILFFTSTITNIDLRDNIFQNSMNNNVSSTAKNYAIYSNAPVGSFTNINYNDYYISGTQGVLGYLGDDKANLAAWKVATTQDANSISADPKFASTTDLHINTIYDHVSNIGIYIASVPTDFDGDVRNASTPDIGADEYIYIPPLVADPTGLTATAFSDTQIDVAFTANANSNNVVIVFNFTGIFTIPSGAPPAPGNPFAGGTLLVSAVTSPYSHTGLTPITKYYYILFSYDGSNYSPGVAVDATTPCALSVLPFNESFDATTFPPDCWTRINAGTGNNWMRGTALGVEPFMIYQGDSTHPANAWMITPGIALEGGKKYNVGFLQEVAWYRGFEKLKVTAGTSPTVESQTTTIWDNAGEINLTNKKYVYRTSTFNCTETGTYYFGFNVYSDANQGALSVDDISIIEQPAVDLSLIKFYQASGLPVLGPGANFSDFNVDLDKNVTTGVSLSQLTDKITGERSTNVNNTLVLKDLNIPFTISDVEVKGIIENFGVNAVSYNFDWVISGVSQTSYIGPSVNPAAKDTATLIFTPAARGTFLTSGSITVSGDEVPMNNTAPDFHLLVYPDNFTRTIYDRGDNIVDDIIGWGDVTHRMKAGVRFTAGEDIKLAGVDFIFRTEGITTGDFQIQVRAASDIPGAPGAVLYTQTYTASDYFTMGPVWDYFYFPFGDDSPIISNGSDYWITIKTPLGILYPSAIHNSGFTPGRSYYEEYSDTTLWGPLVITTERAWIMRSVEVLLAPTTFPLTVNILNGWNMVSIPGLLPTNQNVTSWWPGKDPGAGVFKFNSGYQSVTAVTPGTGYWMKHIGAQTYNTGDEWPAGGINIVPHDPIPGNTGWNLFGGYEQSVPASGITTTPTGLITGSVFKYNAGYQTAASLDPGYGYWVQLTGAGSINIPAGGPTGPSKIANNISTEGFGKITITDNLQLSYTLYAAKGEADLSQFDLPPYPPQGMFDVRYSSQRCAENLSTQQGIEMMGVQYPVKVKAEGTGIILSDETGKEIARLKAGEEITVNTAGKLYVSDNVIPAVYSLEQNYPNPFNPSTTIQFSFPEDVQNVKLIIYSALGEKVAELVNTALQAGIYNYNWNANNLASGLYIYRIVTGKFISTKKMMLLK